MWPKKYRDYKEDEPMIKQQIEPGQLPGCEMHELNGWGTTFHETREKKRGFLASMLIYLFSEKERHE